MDFFPAFSALVVASVFVMQVSFVPLFEEILLLAIITLLHIEASFDDSSRMEFLMGELKN